MAVAGLSCTAIRSPNGVLSAQPCNVYRLPFAAQLLLDLQVRPPDAFSLSKQCDIAPSQGWCERRVTRYSTAVTPPAQATPCRTSD